MSDIEARAEAALKTDHEWCGWRDFAVELLAELKAARSRECTALCTDIEADRDRLTEELKAARAECERLRGAVTSADSILSLLHYRGIVDTERNREDVARVADLLARLRERTR
jgi:hypothetical protein